MLGAAAVAPGVAPSVIGSAAASTETPAAAVSSAPPPVVGVGCVGGMVAPGELGGVEPGAPDGRAVEGL
jgi:hypothetical protein